MSSRWPLVRLAELLRRSDETIEPEPDRDYREITVRLWGKGVVLRGVVPGAQLTGQRRFVARAGQFILSRIDARNGALGVVPQELEGALVTNDFPLFEIQEDRLLPGFLGWLCRTGSFVEACRKASEGTTNRVRVQEQLFLEIRIPLPPLPEQRRLLARIEDLAARISHASEIREGAAAEAEALNLSVLRTAFTISPSKDVKLEEVCDAIIDNLHSNPVYAERGVPCVRSPDVGWGTLHLASALPTSEEEYRRRTIRGEPQTDDLVFVREGGGTGKAAIVLPGQRFSLGQRVMMIRPKKERVEPHFLLYQLLSPLVQEDQIQPLCKGSASPHLNIGAFRQFRFRLPSLTEQRRILNYLGTFRAEVGEVQRRQEDTAAELDALLPAILDRAFKGEL